MENVRDALLIVVAIESVIAILLLIVLSIQIMRLVGLLRREVTPILTSARRTAGTIEGSTSFVARTALGPAIAIAGTVAGIRRFLAVLGGKSKKKGGKRDG